LLYVKKLAIVNYYYFFIQKISYDRKLNIDNYQETLKLKYL